MAHVLQPLCTPERHIRENFYSDTYRATFTLDGYKRMWDFTRVRIPMGEEKEWLLNYRFGIGKDDLPRFYETLERRLDAEMALQGTMLGIKDPVYRNSFVTYVLREKCEEEGIREYYFLSYPCEPVQASGYVTKDGTSYLGILNIGVRLARIIRLSRQQGIEIRRFDLDSLLLVRSDERSEVALGSLVNADLEGTGPLVSESGNAVQAAAELLWSLACGYRDPGEAGADEIPPGIPDGFRKLVLDARNSADFPQEDFEEGLKRLQKAVLRKEADNYAVAFGKPVSKAKSSPSGFIEIGDDLLDQQPEETVTRKWPRFNLKEYFVYKRQLDQIDLTTDTSESAMMHRFEKMCLFVKGILDEMDSNEIREEATLDRQRRALLGYPKETEFYKSKIAEIVNQNGLARAWKPRWYSSVTEAVYGEILGFSGISNWISDERYRDSVSCKIIGDRIFYKENGYLRLQPQRISRERRDLLKRTLLLIAPREPLSKAWHEFYTVAEHLRVTIYNSNGITKDGEDVIIFRRYILRNLTFEEQARRGTIPEESIPLLKAMVRMGVNVCFSGPVESAKSTFLQSYQALEDPKLEGVSIETDDETQYQVLMPGSPIIQFCPSSAEEDTVLERVKRSDANYIVIGESRSGKYLNLAVESGNMGTRRLKTTFHNTQTVDFAYDVAEKITRECGGEIPAFMIKVAKTFNYIFCMASLPRSRGQKRLKGIWEMRFDPDDMEIYMHQICRYVFASDGVPEHWVWDDHIGPEVREIGSEEDPEALEEFVRTLGDLKASSPNTGTTKFRNPYMDVLLKGGSHG